ncbi:endonuclease domain-containing protein [Microbacterium sp. NPDC089987]|uniref:endonuclease domain-containing protein n=1 Tax=Microbacterium sp. NPDC089987 TaxID=3364202 RepID=UPI00380F5F4F
MRTPLLTWMQQRHGVAHSSEVRAAGYSAWTVRAAIEAGMLERVRRSWLVSADCSSQRRAAAEAGGRITCVTAAREKGLWAPDVDETHVAVAPTASRNSRAGLQVHWAQGPLPVARFATEEPLLNALFHVARCLDPMEAAAIWESALRKGLTTLEQLRRTQWGALRPAQVLETVGALSDSGIETTFVRIALACGAEVRQQVVIDGHPVDALIGERLVVQLDGFEFHSEAKDRRRDLRQDARLVLLGYTVLRFDYQQIMFDARYVMETLMNAIAQGLHLASRR